MATDNFDRADNNSLGANWTESETPDTSLRIATNQLRTRCQNTSGGFATYIGTFPANQYSQAVYKGIASVGTFSGPLVRGSGSHSSGSLYCIVVDDGASPEVRLYKFDAQNVRLPEGTLLATDTHVPAVDEVFRIEALGSSIKVLVDDVEIISVVDAAVASGNPGMAAPKFGQNFTLEGNWDDWEGGGLDGLDAAEGSDEIDFAESLSAWSGLGGEASESLSLSESAAAVEQEVDFLSGADVLSLAESMAGQLFGSLSGSLAESLVLSDAAAGAGSVRTGPGMVLLGRMGLAQGDEWISDVPTRHPSRYYKGRAKFGSLRRSVELPAGLPQVADGSVELADDDSRYRQLFAQRDPRGREMDLRLLPEGEREIAAQQIYRGEITRSTFPEGEVKVDFSDSILSFLDESVPSLGTVANFPNMGREAFIPIIIGNMLGTAGLVECPMINETFFDYAVSRYAVESVDEVQIKRKDDDDFAPTDQYVLTSASVSEGGVDYSIVTLRLFAVSIDKDTKVRVQVKGRLAASGTTAERNPANALKKWLTDNVGLAVSDLDAAAFAESASRATTAGYNCDGAIVQSITHREFISRLSSSFNLMVFPNRYGQISCKLPTVDEATAFEVGELLAERQSVQPMLPEPPYNRIRYRYNRNPAEGTWETEQFHDNDPSIDNLGKTYETDLEMWFVREASAAAKIAEDFAGYYDPAAYRVEFDLPAPEAVSEIEIGSQISMTHYSGVDSGGSGWTSKKFRVTGITLEFSAGDYLRMRVSAVSRVVPPAAPVQALLDVDWAENSTVGPYHRGGGLMYLIFRDGSNAKKLNAWKSVDWGAGWSAIEGPTLSGNIGSFDSQNHGSKILVVTQESDGRTAFHRFDMVSGAWDVSDEQIRAAPASPPTQRWCSICGRRSSGEPVIFAAEAPETVDGTSYMRQFAARRASAGSWTEYAFGAGEKFHYRGGRPIPGRSNLVHFFFERSPGTVISGTPDGYHSTLTDGNTLRNPMLWYGTSAAWLATTHNVGQYATKVTTTGIVEIYLPVKGNYGGAAIYRFTSAEEMTAAETYMWAEDAIPYQGEATLDGSTRYPHLCLGTSNDGSIHAIWPAFVSLSGDRWEVHKSTGASGEWVPPEAGVAASCANSLGNRCSMQNRAGALVPFPLSIQKMCALFFDLGGSVWVAKVVYHSFTTAQKNQLGIDAARRTVFELLRIDRDVPRAASFDLQALVDALS